ncbi:MAG: hypothetical protein HN348_15595, partial [Proteobacteria bacterium]|nr:hypothetical protein [Pseudomonadota bacterium]
ERTFGKGSVQNLHQFFDESKLKITISQYLTPGDRSIQSVGIPADIELIPSVIGSNTDEASGKERDIALLFSRERVRREADLDKHLERHDVMPEVPVYQIRYLMDKDFERRRRSAALDLSKDYEVQFARDVLLEAPSYHRAEMLASANKVVERHRRDGEKEIEQAFKEIDIDWSSGPSVSKPALDVKLDLGEDGQLIAGEEETIALEVTNTGNETIYRLAATVDENEVFKGREFFFGKLAPQETRRFEHQVKLVHGYPTESSPVTFDFRDGTNKDLLSIDAAMSVSSQPLPELSWSWSFKEIEGNNDGRAQVGEEVALSVTFENTGKSPTTEAYARVRNRSGRAIDIVNGTLEPGTMVNEDGTPCEVIEPGIETGNIIGDPVKGAERIEAGERPVYAEKCHRQLQPGHKWTGEFALLIKEPLDEGYKLELSLGDARAYDHASIVRAGFYSYFSQKEDIEFQLQEPLPRSNARIAPDIEITRLPPSETDLPRVTVSGVATDDSGIAHLLVFAAEDKVFYQGRGRNSTERKVPFTADITLEPGLNTITVLATDNDGFVHSQSVVTYHPEPQTHASADPAEE